MAHRATTSNRVHARAPGKINVYLKVGAVREDGYHELATAFQSLSLYEDVRASDAPDFSVEFSGSIDTRGLAVDGSNLAIKAARALARATGYRGGVHLEIEKNVPIAGGMGGGSADAAATLLACDALWGTACTREQLLGIAAGLGADVPFSFTGGTAIGVGRGDELSPALAKGRFEWVLVLSEQGLSTPEVYRELDRHRERHLHDFRPISATPSIEPNVLQALRAGDAAMLADAMHNDLQAPALHLQPGLARILERGEESGALGGLVSGSGPTVAFLLPDADAALDLQLELTSARLRAVRVSGPVHGARLLST
ncbi:MULTISPECIES: 4-(cytidine 5'-diphospho)-2-C-methyl-D-erythritol kinase [Rathayibacter]|jgi:4-diphosphocytidyl-2-C-methyl-D-erythritol kinase|uniref:4-diphosphocytidyl-2-C-methyl-D-erythritol kinase n=2 Tax=Rathayibacter festucae TaxID=110937 RepID=A0A3Q9UYS9_9MICO|nr:MULTISPECIES: 4-(cytidine 5'-diphospho)-2-C-methyl-D-erythritol kinase [Rathayibacter]AZZ52518.1 4-(cytidine 5'-diphospho)-2-C-methyl-D-erythritol kinase [Rathayibacter festucae DSM 15932]MCJ1672243.1 4-(cytidine 5'-diphospho)-2-C-methyl-D-erythritol kinase [Rathayibacter sp. VKM Ac-2929]MCJ1683626.1 4-(cytidine 5'-diphospho)-2-C-methyl-D-erythritol kinase [Rathayibacter sp. VKM Ac-2928]MCJ1688838.1 4-(cytidine 5'-diphospho)-2-C-methyl-D-erythritol kinase [Rathayibacter sp. VKM Ac-2927]MCJ1